MGMTPEQYWDEDPWLFAAYREAAMQQNDIANAQAWLSGYYTYEALCRVAPALGFASGSVKPWLERPIGISDEAHDAKEREKKEKAAADAGIAYLLSVTATK